MNKSAIKGFSVRARRKLIEDISQKAYALGIKGTGKYDNIEEFEGGFRVKNAVNQIIYPLSTKKDREKLIAEINRKGFEQVVEEVAYTWFNRIIAIRFMEINEYLPVKVRMLSSDVQGKTEPDVITHIYDYVSDLELDREKVFNLKENHKDEELFKYVFVKECNNLGKLMPQVFEAIGDYTELLLPDQLLSSGSVIRDLVESIDEEDFKEEVEIIGWMYQYYNTDNNELVYDGSMKRGRIPKELLPAATQIFTPKWVVEYMVQNSIGKICIESCGLKNNIEKMWEYYIKDDISVKSCDISIENVRVIDPSMGSGHMLVYAFELLLNVYLDLGYRKRDAVKCILEKNLFGIDIDDRAYQISCFALLMKARQYDRRVLNEQIDLNIFSICESNNISKGIVDFINFEDKELKQSLEEILQIFIDGKEYGSVLKVKPFKYDKLIDQLNQIKSKTPSNLFESIYINQISELVCPLINQAKILSEKYDVVITNPPYLNSSRMSSKLNDYVKMKFPENNSDLSMIFYQKSIEDFCKKNGYVAFVTTNSWMYLKSFENIRLKMISEMEFESLVDLGTELFDGKVGHNPIVAWVNKSSLPTKKMHAIDLTQFCYSRRDEKTIEFHNMENWYFSDQRKFKRIPGSPIAYSVSERFIENFDNGESINEYSDYTGSQNKTADNQKYLRYFWEVSKDDIGADNKWVLYAKGGEYKKYYGNLQYVVNWTDSAREFYKTNKTSNLLSSDYWYKSGITYTDVSSKGTGFRVLPAGCVFDMSGPSLVNVKHFNYFIGLLNSKVSSLYFRILNPTIHLQVKDVKALPILFDENKYNQISETVKENIDLAKDDWDKSEGSIDFKEHPYVDIKNRKSKKLSLIAKNVEIEENNTFERLKQNEELLNTLFIEIYGLYNDVESSINDSDITLKIRSVSEQILDLVHYFIGLVLGRYSLDEEGVVCTNKELILSKYKTFKPTEDNILIITEEDYLENDILHRFIEFINVTFSEETLEENLKFIADVLNPKSKDTPRQTLRNYFVKDFYNDHLKMYKKRPIYWQIDSGKQNGIKALFYMHRYDKSTIARFRTDYLHEIQRYYENDIELTERSNDKKKVDNLKKKLQEVTEFDKVVAHIANQQIEFDLDDGVEHNYELFQGVEVPQGDGQKPMKADLLAKRK